MTGGERRSETRYAGVGGDPKDNLKINQMMLRFRPIAPKPVTVSSSVRSVPLKEKRAKRKYVRVKKKKKKISAGSNMAVVDVFNGGKFVVTDPVSEWISFDVNKNNRNDIVGRLITPVPPSSIGLHDVDLATTLKRGQVIESWITMESVTGTCEDGGLLGEEIWKDLEMDSCPVFISNGYDEVQWVNHAYRRMVDPNPDGSAPPSEVVVWLGLKVEKSAFLYWPAFSCRVRLVYKLSEKKKKQMTVPCDVWKMKFGGYAWRLDVKAALSLGRLD